MIINNTYIDSVREGLILSFEAKAASLPPVLHEYTFYTPWYFDPEIQRRRLEHATPRVLGYMGEISDGPDIISNSFTIKSSASYDVGIPACFGFALPMVRLVAEDVLVSYGTEKFRKSEMDLIVQRTDVPCGEAARTHFSHWHKHLDNNLDRTYIYANKLPTEFKMNGQITAARENSIICFGGEIEHRSQKNAGESLRRIWIAITVKSGPETSLRAKNAQPLNIALFRPSPDFHAAAAKVLANISLHVRPIIPSPLENWRPLADVA